MLVERADDAISPLNQRFSFSFSFSLLLALSENRNLKKNVAFKYTVGVPYCEPWWYVSRRCGTGITTRHPPQLPATPTSTLAIGS